MKLKKIFYPILIHLLFSGNKAMSSLTVFANFRIDSEERLIRMKDSFHSFYKADIDKWVINIRGDFKKEARQFLKDNLADRLVLFELESRWGWAHDSRKMLKAIASDYVFFWIEDHICLPTTEYFNKVIRDMRQNHVEHLHYSFFKNGEILKSFRSAGGHETETIVWDVNDLEKQKARESFASPYYLISCCSITSRRLFSKLVTIRDPFIRKWSKHTPFNFEKPPQAINWLPLVDAFPNKEFFLPIDDEYVPQGSLISRGQYPQRKSYDEMTSIRIQSENSGLGTVSSSENCFKKFVAKVIKKIRWIENQL